jgi:hypothetical protein
MRTSEAVGVKFHADGRARRFSGNTVISMLPISAKMAAPLRTTVAAVTHRAPGHYAILPEDSWHMTVFELLADQVRDREHWSQYLDLHAPIAVTDTFLAQAVASVVAPEPLTMRFSCLRGIGGITASLEPAQDGTHQALAGYRERLSEVTGIRFPDHDAYRFHITLAYEIRPVPAPTQQSLSAGLATAEAALVAAGTCELPAPQFVTFEDMTAFAAQRLANDASFPPPEPHPGSPPAAQPGPRWVG